MTQPKAAQQGNLGPHRRRFRSDHDVTSLARCWASDWIAGAPIGRWLKHHVVEMTRLSREDGWSWQDLAEAMNRAGILYRTGRPWSADLLNDKAARARRELRAAAAKEDVPGNALMVPSPSAPVSTAAKPDASSMASSCEDDLDPSIADEPEFKLATPRGWMRPGELSPAGPTLEPDRDPKPASALMPTNDPAVNAVLAEFLARPRRGAIPMPKPFEPEED